MNRLPSLLGLKHQQTQAVLALSVSVGISFSSQAWFWAAGVYRCAPATCSRGRRGSVRIARGLGSSLAAWPSNERGR